MERRGDVSICLNLPIDPIRNANGLSDVLVCYRWQSVEQLDWEASWIKAQIWSRKKDWI
jgi:hypothetical protein